MTSTFPVPLDNLIAFVKAQQPQGDPLGELSAAVSVAEQLDQQSDALIGHFVDQARRSGASWSQIGTSMGVSKQAAQKRFVGGDVLTERQLFSRVTPRARNVLGLAQLAAGGAPMPAAAVVACLHGEPGGLAAVILTGLGVDEQKLSAATGFSVPAARGAEVDDSTFADDTQELMRGTLKAALRLGHNYVGTEHLLLGALLADLEVTRTLEGLGVTVEAVESALTAELAKLTAGR